MGFTRVQDVNKEKLKQLLLQLVSALLLKRQLTLEMSLLLSWLQVLTSIGNFCICSIVVGMVIQIIVIYGIHGREYHIGIDNVRVRLIGGFPIAMPTVLSVTVAIGSYRLSQQGLSHHFGLLFGEEIDKYIVHQCNIKVMAGPFFLCRVETAIEEMVGMDVPCSDKTGSLMLNKLTVDKNVIEVFLLSLHSTLNLSYMMHHLQSVSHFTETYHLVSQEHQMKLSQGNLCGLHLREMHQRATYFTGFLNLVLSNLL